jgi:phosphatidylglycerophosphate synthase
MRGAWALAFWLLIIALLTDFFDGLAAKKLNVRTKFGEEFDPFADSSLVIAGFVALTVTGHTPLWATVAVLLSGALIGSDHVFPAKKRGNSSPLRTICAVAGLFMAWIYIAWNYATQVFGWRWWYVALTVFILLICALFKRHRLRTWMGLA